MGSSQVGPPPPPGFELIKKQGLNLPPPPPGFEIVPQGQTIYTKGGGDLPPGLPGRVYSVITGALPYLGGAVGGITGGIPGAMLGGAAGESAKIAISPEPPPPTFPAAATDIAKAGVEQGLYEAIPRGVTGVLGRFFRPERLYQSALKPPLTATGRPKIPEIIRTGLEERVPVSETGAAKVEDLIEGINNEVMQQVQGATGRIDPAQVVQRLDQLRQFYGKSADPRPYLQAIDRIEEGFLLTHGGAVPVSLGGTTPLVPTRTLAIPDAQAIKQAEGRIVRKSYGELSGAEAETRKQIVRGLKEEIEKAMPGIKELNDRERRLIDLEGALDRYVARHGNLQMTGIGTPIMAAGVGLATGNPKMALEAGLLRGALEMPSIKSRLAIALDIMAKKTAGARGAGLNLQNISRGIGAAMTSPPPSPPPQNPMAEDWLDNREPQRWRYR